MLGMGSVKRLVMRKQILQEIFSNFQMMTQSLEIPNDYASYYNRALALIELLEVEDCGSVGGFDRDNPMVRVTGFDEYDRFLTLLRKEKIKLQKEIYFTPESMIEFWSKIFNFREEFNKDE